MIMERLPRERKQYFTRADPRKKDKKKGYRKNIRYEMPW